MPPEVKTGSRVKLIRSQDEYSSPPAGTEGTVSSVDSLGTIHVNWDNGSTLGLIPSVDAFSVLLEEA